MVNKLLLRSSWLVDANSFSQSVFVSNGAAIISSGGCFTIWCTGVVCGVDDGEIREFLNQLNKFLSGAGSDDPNGAFCALKTAGWVILLECRWHLLGQLFFPFSG